MTITYSQNKIQQVDMHQQDCTISNCYSLRMEIAQAFMFELKVPKI